MAHTVLSRFLRYARVYTESDHTSTTYPSTARQWDLLRLLEADYLLQHSEIKHGPLRICFTPDEEVGRGVEHLDLNELSANVAYTLDGGGAGQVAWETFSADEAKVSIEGVSTHPGDAKKKRMVNAVHLAAKLLAALPREDLAPESTENREGYLHPARIHGNAARVELTFILRDFNLEGLNDKGDRLRGLCRGIQASEPRAKIACRISPQYRNMGYWLKQDMTPVNLADEAVRAIGLEPTPDRKRLAHPQSILRWSQCPRPVGMGGGAGYGSLGEDVR